MVAIVRPYGDLSARIMLVGEGPTRSEALSGKMYNGQSGKDLVSMLHQAGILFSECYVTSVCRQNIPDKFHSEGSGKYFSKYTKTFQIPKIEVEQGRALLLEEIASVKPTLIIALGELALWALTGELGITKWRGSIVEREIGMGDGTSNSFKIIPTYAPDVIQRKYDWRFIALQDLRRCAAEAKFPEVRVPDYKFIIRPSFNEVMEVLDHLSNVAAVRGTWDDKTRSQWDCMGSNLSPQNGFTGVTKTSPLILGGDIETRHGHITCFGIAWSKTEAICIPFTSVQNGEGYWSEEEEIAIVWKLMELFKRKDIAWVFQNGLYDYQYFAKHWGTIPNIYMDTMLIHHTCYAGLPKGLDFQSSLYCMYHRYWKDDGKEFHSSIKTTADEDKYWVYNCKDCVTELEIAETLEKVVKSLGQQEPASFQMRQFPVVLRMMLRGVRIDRKRKSALAMELLDAIAVRTQWLIDVMGEHILLGSHKKMQKFFYDDLGLPVQKNKKTKRPTTDALALETLGKKEPLVKPLTDMIAETRSLGVFLSTFVKAPLDTDGRMRSSYNIAGTETFRWSSSQDAFGTGMNLQNIPKGDE